MEAERARVAREIENLTAAVAGGGGEIPQLVVMLKDRDKRLKNLDARLATRETPDRERLLTALEHRAQDWRRVLREEHPRLSRIVLMQLMGPLEVHHSEQVPHWVAEPRPQGLLVGMVHELASPTGFEPVF